MDTQTPTITLQSLTGRATISIPEAGRLLSLGRSASYDAARRGEIPTIPFGHRKVVPVPRLLAMLGIDPAGP